jgi:hypothetical protein
MTHKLKSLFTGPRSLESRLTTALESRSRDLAGSAPTQPFELVELAAEEVASHVHLAGRGRYAFPYNSVTITFAAATSENQARFHAICAGPPSIQARVLQRLAGAGCEVSDADVDVRVGFVPEADASWTQPFHLALARIDARSRPARARVSIDLLVTHGTADRGAFTFDALPIAIGRGAEVRDSRHQLLRINHVAFADGDDEVNKSVSRRHARIEMDDDSGRPRIIDDNSAQGTSVIRKGRGIPIPKGSRGLSLQSGDEIVLGQARLKVTVGSDTGV